MSALDDASPEDRAMALAIARYLLAGCGSEASIRARLAALKTASEATGRRPAEIVKARVVALVGGPHRHRQRNRPLLRVL